MYTEEKLTIHGYQSEPVPHTFLRQAVKAKYLAFLLPGMGYSAHMPLLFYPQQIVAGMGMDVLRAEYAYGKGWLSLENKQRGQWLYSDASAIDQAGMAQGDYQGVVIVGKSIGSNSTSSVAPSEGALRRPRIRVSALRTAAEARIKSDLRSESAARALINCVRPASMCCRRSRC